MLTLETFQKEWSHCCKCPLHKNARRHVLYRGEIPAEVLLVGEAPGKTEDKHGLPFIGASGQRVLNKALEALELKSFCICNVVCCIPVTEQSVIDDEEFVPSVRPPSPEEAEACRPHLEQIVELCQPKLIALLGNEPKKYFPASLVPQDATLVTLRHPAYVLRRGGEKGVEYKRFLEAFHTALEEQGIAHTNPFNPIGV